MSTQLSRRHFLKKTAIAAGAAAVAQSLCGPYLLAANAPNEKLNVALIGCGGRGGQLLPNFAGENIVALVDANDKGIGTNMKFLTDKGSAEKHKFQIFEQSKIKTFKDYRKLFDVMGKEINAVVIATPNHHHAPPALMAMKRGINCYVEKPMAHYVWETREMAKVAKENKVVTQMGNQGHSGGGYRMLVEYIQAGAIGNVLETHSWSDRANGGSGPRPPDEPVPAGMDWEMWIGPSPFRNYHKDLHPHEWHGWHDFGNGSLGNMGCHVLDGVHWALKLEHPTSIVVEEQGGGSDERCHTGTKIRWDYPARGDLPPVKVYWWDGKKKGIKKAVPGDTPDSVGQASQNRPPLVDELEKKYDRKFGGNGTIYIGDKGMMYSGTYGEGSRIIPEEKHKEYKAPAQTLPRIKGSHQGDFIRACKGGEPPASTFEVASKLTELVLLGSVAMKAGLGKKLEWDGPNMKVTNLQEMNAWINHEYRKGWEL